MSVDAARSLILDRISPVGVEEVELVSAAGRVLAADRNALRAVPSFDNSAMDGVGVRAVDVAGASKERPVELRVVGFSLPGRRGSAAGLASAARGAEGHSTAAQSARVANGRGAPVELVAMAPGDRLGAFEAVRIMTGAPVPAGVDAIVMRELTDETRAHEGVIAVAEAAPAGQHIRRRGEDVNEGEPCARAGDVVTPARLNAMLCAGVVRVVVHRRPIVAILASGDELREIGAPLDNGSVPNSNAHGIGALVRAAGCDARLVGIAGDSLDDHIDKMKAGLAADALVTIGGVSMGTHDFVRPALAKLGGTLEMWQVAMRPGRPIAFGRVASVPVFALPGNPVSAHVAAELFLQPALAKLAGARSLLRPLWAATLLQSAFAKKKGLEHWARGEAVLVDRKLQVRVLDEQGSHHVTALARANALVRFDVDVERVAPGDDVELLLLNEPCLLERQR